MGGEVLWESWRHVCVWRTSPAEVKGSLTLRKLTNLQTYKHQWNCFTVRDVKSNVRILTYHSYRCHDDNLMYLSNCVVGCWPVHARGSWSPEWDRADVQIGWVGVWRVGDGSTLRWTMFWSPLPLGLYIVPHSLQNIVTGLMCSTNTFIIIVNYYYYSHLLVVV